MNIKEICASLEDLGWRTETDDVGDKLAFFDLPDRTMHIIPDLRRIHGKQQLSVSPTVSTRVFCEACQHIQNMTAAYAPLVRAWKSSRVTSTDILAEHVQRITEEAINWGKDQDLNKALREYAALPTTVPGARPVWHLGALAVLGEMQRLKSYRKSLEAGDRLGFVNYVTQDYIDRALYFSQMSSNK